MPPRSDLRIIQYVLHDGMLLSERSTASAVEARIAELMRTLGLPRAKFRITDQDGVPLPAPTTP